MAQTVDEIAELIQNMRVESENNAENIEKILTNINTKLEALDDDNEKSDLIRVYISELRKSIEDRHNTSLVKFDEIQDSFKDVLASIKHLNIEDDLKAQINSLAETLAIQISAVPQKISFSNLEEKIDLFKPVIQSLEQVITDSKEQNTKIITENFEKLQNSFENIITESNFKDFKSDLADFVQKIIDNSNSLNNELTYNKDKIESILETINSLNFQEDFENITNKIEEIKEAFEKGSTTNYSKLSSEISKLAENFNDNFAHMDTGRQAIYTELKSEMTSILDNLKLLSGISYQKSFDELSGITSEIVQKLSTLHSKFENASQNNYNNLKTDLDNIVFNIQNLKNDKENNLLNINQKLDNFSYILSAIKGIVEISAYSNSNNVEKQIEKLEKTYKNSITTEDFSMFKSEFQEFIQKIIDSTNIANVNSDTVKEQIIQVLEKLETLNFDGNFENISGCINDIRLSFENNSKMNYENILNEINSLKSEINSNIQAKTINDTQYSESINSKLDELMFNVQHIDDTSSQRHTNMLNSLSSELNDKFNEILSQLNSDTEINFGDIKIAIGNISSEINKLKDEFEAGNQSKSIFNILENFENTRTVLNELSLGLNSLNESFETKSSNNVENITEKIETISLKIEELKNEMGQSIYIEKALEAINELSIQISEAFDNNSIDQKLISLRDAIMSLSSDFQLSKEETAEHIRTNFEIQNNNLQSISNDVAGIKQHINDTIDSLKNYMSEVENISSESRSENFEKLSSKLVDIESSLLQSSQNYEQNISSLQSKLLEFAHIVENSNSDTEGKISSSLEQISNIKDELVIVNEILKNSTKTNDEKFNETISLLDAGVENITFSLNSLNENIQTGINSKIQENINTIETKFSDMSEILSDIKLQTGNNEIISDINEQVTKIGNSINLLTGEVTEAIESKCEGITKAFNPIMSTIDELMGLDFQKVLGDLKSQIELSFLNINADMNNDFSEQKESLTNLKEAYRDVYEKVNSIEECINNNIQNNIELINTTLQSSINDIKNEYSKNFEDNVEEIKAHIDVAFNDTKIIDSINDLKQELIHQFDESKSSALHEKTILAGISSVTSNLKEYINTISKALIEKYNPSELLSINSKIENISKDLKDNLSQTLNILNMKVDTIATDSTTLNILDEIDDIRNVILEQNKVFETSSDKKAAAINNCLKDVLLKIDNIDIERNTEDIKESILGALISVVDQISFVEETEDIKDFVEEKTDKLHQGLVEVQNQLKQLASSDDDFEYTYTLQDVESDIAKLRLAINKMTNEEFDDHFEDLNNEIQKITDSIENLETSLTQDEIIEIREDIIKVNEELLSLSTRTNKLLLNSDESYKAINEGLDNFNNLIYKLEDKLNNTNIENKLDLLQNYAETSAKTDKVIQKVMMYLGEWIDSTTENISSISEKTEQIPELQENLNSIINNLPKKDELIDELKELIPDNTGIIEKLKLTLDSQEQRIETLENRLDRIVSLLEEKDDIVLNRKIDKLEKLISGLGANIEKLTSYVDE